MKEYQKIAIAECGEKLVAIPHTWAFTEPHAYMALGATYGNLSPFYVRQGVLKRLELALSHLQTSYPQWRIKIFDAYRPVPVQQFMVEYTKQQVAKAKQWDWQNLSPLQDQELTNIVEQFWAPPSLDPATPPPHSTGAAVDVTLVDQNNYEVEMGSAIDLISERSHPDYFAKAQTAAELKFHTHRQLLFDSMTTAGFQQHPNEWWHFSFGDQMWAWRRQDLEQVAIYGIAA